MKFIQNITKTLLAMCVLSAMVACDEESAPYAPSIVPTNEQVYFSNTTSPSMDFTMEDSVFNVSLCRANTKGDLDVAIHATQSPYFTVPNKVHFADGDSVAVLAIEFDPEVWGYDNPQQLTISVADSAMITPYGIASFTLKLNMPAPWTTLGEASVIDDVITTFFGTKNPEIKCDIQENDLVPGFYRLVNPYTSNYPPNEDGDYDDTKDYYIYIHAEDPNAVYIERSELGLNWGYGMFSIWSLADYLSLKGSDPTGTFGTLREGEIKFPVKSLMISMADYNGGGWNYANLSGLFSVLLPGYERADYSLSVSYAGIFTDKQDQVHAVGQLEAGANATDLLAVVRPASDDPSAVADALASGDLEEGVKVSGTRIDVPFNHDELDGENKLQIIVVALKNGEVKTVASDEFEYYGGASNPWKSIGKGQYTETILSSMYASHFELATYEVDIVANDEEPGIYRVMNPYNNNVHSFAPAGNYLEINAQDPQGVYIAKQSLGFDLGEGELFFETEGAYYLKKYDLEVVKRAGLLGKIEKGVISFPILTAEENEAIRYQGFCYVGNDLYYCALSNPEVGMTVVLPGAEVASAPMKARSQFVNSLDLTLRATRFVPKVNKKMILRHAQPVR